MSSDEQAVQAAHQRAVTLTEQRRYDEASVYFSNALAHAPGDVALIGDYVTSILQAVEEEATQSDRPAALDKLNWCLAFLLEQATQVAPDDIAGVLELRNEVVQRLEALTAQAAAAQEPDPESVALEKELRQGVKAGFVVNWAQSPD